MIISHIIFCKYGKQVETSGDRCARVCRIESGSASLVEGFFPINHCFVFGCVHLLSHSLGLP